MKGKLFGQGNGRNLWIVFLQLPTFTALLEIILPMVPYPVFHAVDTKGLGTEKSLLSGT